MDDFKWMHKSEVKVIENGLVISATPHSNCFVDPASGTAVVNAPFYSRSRW